MARAARRGNNLGAWIGVATALALSAALAALVLRSDERRHASGSDAGAIVDARVPAPEPTGAYATGGKPEGGPAALREAFASRLPAVIIALDAWGRARRDGQVNASREQLDRARAQVLGVAGALGTAATAALRRLLDAAERTTEAPAAELDDKSAELSRAMLELNAALMARGLGYVIDADVREYDDGRRFVLLFSFGVEQVALYRSGTHVIRALRVERLDKLNWSYNLLGFATAERTEAIVLLDQVEDRLVDRVLPLLGKEPPPFYRLEPAELRSRWHRKLDARIRDVVRAEYGMIGGDRSVHAALARLGQLLARRRALFDRWRRTLNVARPSRLTLRWSWRKELAPMVPRAELRALARIEAELASAPMQAAYRAAEDRLSRSIERHEAQHRLDHLRDQELPMPEPLRDFVGRLRGEDGAVNQAAARARAELSAYLAELSRDPDTTRVGLAIITQFAVDSDYWGAPESYAAIVLLEQLSRKLGLRVPKTLVVERRIDRTRVTAAYLALSAVPRAKLREGARQLWAELFGSELPRLTLASR